MTDVRRVALLALGMLLIPHASEAARPVRVASLSLPGRPLSLAFDETRGLLLVGTRKNPTAPELYAVAFGDDRRTPELAWSLELGAKVNAIAVDESRAYVATSLNRSELVIVDLETGAPLGAFDAPGKADALMVEVGSPGVVKLGRRFSGDREFFRLDVSDPSDVRVLKAGNRPRSARRPPPAVLDRYAHKGAMVGCVSPDPGLHYVVVTDKAAEVQVAEDLPSVVFADANGDGIYRLGCLGDSNTAVTLPVKPWCERLLEMLDDPAVEVVNVAEAGGTVVSPNKVFTSEAVMQMGEVLGHDVDAVVLAFGTNDRIQGRSAAEIVGAYISLEEVAADAGIEYFVATTPPMGSCVGEGCTHIFPTNALLREAFPGRVVEFFDGFTKTEHFMDNLHLNDAGQELRAERAGAVMGNPPMRQIARGMRSWSGRNGGSHGVVQGDDRRDAVLRRPGDIRDVSKDVRNTGARGAIHARGGGPGVRTILFSARVRDCAAAGEPPWGGTVRPAAERGHQHDGR